MGETHRAGGQAYNRPCLLLAKVAFSVGNLFCLLLAKVTCSACYSLRSHVLLATR